MHCITLPPANIIQEVLAKSLSHRTKEAFFDEIVVIFQLFLMRILHQIKYYGYYSRTDEVVKWLFVIQMEKNIFPHL